MRLRRYFKSRMRLRLRDEKSCLLVRCRQNLKMLERLELAAFGTRKTKRRPQKTNGRTSKTSQIPDVSAKIIDLRFDKIAPLTGRVFCM